MTNDQKTDLIMIIGGVIAFVIIWVIPILNLVGVSLDDIINYIK